MTAGMSALLSDESEDTLVEVSLSTVAAMAGAAAPTAISATAVAVVPIAVFFVNAFITELLLTLVAPVRTVWLKTFPSCNEYFRASL